MYYKGLAFSNEGFVHILRSSIDITFSNSSFDDLQASSSQGFVFVYRYSAGTRMKTYCIDKEFFFVFLFLTGHNPYKENPFGHLNG